MLASGSGTNLQALIDTPRIRPHIRIVISDNGEARALARAEVAGIPTQTIRFADFETRAEFSTAVAETARRVGARYLVLAGFMRILSPVAIDMFPGRIINVHPSLLPSFPGTGAVAQALEAGVKVTGVTVHIVDEGVDTGPILAQRAVPVLSGDDEESLHARIQVEEHDLLPQVVAEILSETVEEAS